MLQLENPTPLAAAMFMLPDEHGVDTLYVLVKATFVSAPGTPLAAEQVRPCLADEYWGTPGESSPKACSEVHLEKPTTDVLVVGSAFAPPGKTTTKLEASLRVGKLERRVSVTGDRVWKRGIVSTRPSEPVPFESMPLRWERAFGGVHVLDAERGKILAEGRNPVGCGFRGKRASSELEGKPVPNLEDPRHALAKLGQHVEPVCFAPIAAHWLPRREYAGTYDEAWQRTRAPYLPLDFDARYFQCAPAGQVSQQPLEAGAPVELHALSRDGARSFELPQYVPRADATVAGSVAHLALRLETVLFDTERDVFTLAWRAALRCDKRALQVQRVRIDAPRWPEQKPVAAA